MDTVQSLVRQEAYSLLGLLMENSEVWFNTSLKYDLDESSILRDGIEMQ